LRETQLVTIQQFLLSELGARVEPEATQTLIEITTDPATAPLLMTEARRLLSARRTGAEFMLKALESHYDFLSGILVTPPVGPLADALANIGDSRAAPLLAEHLNDPANTTEDVERAAVALEKLATLDEYEALKTFFALYRSTAGDEHLVTAVQAVARGLARIGGPDARDIIARAAADPTTVAGLRDTLRQLGAAREYE
jgi:outer membrane protein assembly factor BamB